MSSRRKCVYTVLLGGYETLNEQPIAKDSSIEFVCFTDRSDLTSETWTIRKIEPILPLDAPRSSRHPKICPHLYLPDHDLSLYVDNSIALTSRPEEIFAEWFETQDANMVCLAHSFRDSIVDEFDEVVRLGLDDASDCYEQLEHYLAIGMPDELPVIWGGLMLRAHHAADVVACMDSWMTHVLRYSRRDQLSFPFVARQHGLRHTALPLDNFETAHHRWPIASNRESRRYLASAARRRHLVLRMKDLRVELTELRAELEVTRSDAASARQEATVAHSDADAARSEATRANEELRTIREHATRLEHELGERSRELAESKGELEASRELIEALETRASRGASVPTPIVKSFAWWRHARRRVARFVEP